MSDLSVRSFPSTAVNVTFFEDRAEVRRKATVVLESGSGWVGVTGVSPFADDASLEVHVAADKATVTAAKIRRRVHHEQRLGAAQVGALEAELRQAEEAHARARHEGERARAAAGQAQRLVEEWQKALAKVPRLAADAERLAEWRAAFREAASAVDAAGARAHAAQLAEHEASETHQRALVRLHEGLGTTPRHDTLVEVQLDARSAGETELELVYRTPCALWRPEHLARLVTGDGPPRLELTSYATAWQRTGEAWEGVAARFSTARTARAAEPPRLIDDVLAQRKKTEQEKKQVVVEAREQAVAVAGLDRGSRVVDEMPGVDDGGEPLSFAATAPVSFASDGRPLRVELGKLSLPVAVATVLLPEKTEAAHLRATATLARSEPILAGPVTVARDAGVVGRAQLPFVAGGEVFELGFGVVDELRVKRRVDEERDVAALTGKQTVARKVKLFLTNLSDQPRRVEICERVPVSEIEEVQIELDDAGWRFESKDGFARRELELAAGEHKDLELRYTIRAAAKVTLPF